MHGTPFESNKGQAVSHGCVRVYNADLKTMRDLPLGTPVIIRS
jgi:lipoprotein-anchoring transpeptidase ErfK/SrfK